MGTSRDDKAVVIPGQLFVESAFDRKCVIVDGIPNSGGSISRLTVEAKVDADLTPSSD